MLTNEQFLSQTVINGLFYLRTIREFCANIKLAFLSKNQVYIDKAREFSARCEEIGGVLIEYADNNIDQKALEGQFLVTEYTLPCELLTEDLFGIKIATDITRKELALKPGVPTNVSDQTVELLNEQNRKALALCQEFAAFLKDIFAKEKRNELFSYSYPHLIKFMIEETELYETLLDRIINKQAVDPSYVTDYEYMFTASMKDSAMFLRDFVNPSNEEIVLKFNSYIAEFDNLLTDYKQTSLSPDNQKRLTGNTLKTVTRYAKFIADCIRQLLDAKLYFIVEPIFLDNIYTEANYFKYVLTRNKSEETAY